MSSREDSISENIQKKHDKFPFYDVVPHLIYLANDLGHIVHVNELFAKFSKKAEDDLEDEGGLGWLKNVHPDDVFRTMTLWSRSLRDGSDYENTYRLLNKNNEYQWFLTRANKIDLFGDQYSWIGTCTDISEQMELSQSLNQQKTLLSSVISNLPVGVLIAEYPSGRVIMNNQVMNMIWKKRFPLLNKVSDYEKMIGYNNNGKRFNADDWPLAKSISTGQVVDGEIIEIMRGDGTKGLIKMSSLPINDTQNHRVLAVAICEDIHDKVVLEKEKLEALNAAQAAMEANKLKSIFLANMSHDIRTPMNGVLGCADLLSETELTIEQREYLNIIKDSGKVLLGLINDVLDLSKIEAGKFELDNLPYSLEEMLDTLVQISKSSLSSTDKFLTITIEKKNMVKTVKGDRKRMERVIGNLLSNAVKFTPSGGSVTVTAVCSILDETTMSFFCSVKDTGIGIPEDIQSKLFSAFVQADSSTTRKFGGSGLGLSICKDIVTLMKGKIWVKSIPNEGSTFSFNVPMEIDSTELSQIPMEEIFTSSVKQRENSKLLLVEDNKVNGLVARKILIANGYLDVDWVTDGVQAISSFLQKDYDLILMDCQMPIMDGFDASRKIRNLGGTLPILAFTASVLEEERLRCIECGMNDVVLKPVDKNILLSKLDKYIFGKQKSN